MQLKGKLPPRPSKLESPRGFRGAPYEQLGRFVVSSEDDLARVLQEPSSRTGRVIELSEGFVVTRPIVIPPQARGTRLLCNRQALTVASTLECLIHVKADYCVIEDLLFGIDDSRVFDTPAFIFAAGVLNTHVRGAIVHAGVFYPATTALRTRIQDCDWLDTLGGSWQSLVLTPV